MNGGLTVLKDCKGTSNGGVTIPIGEGLSCG